MVGQAGVRAAPSQAVPLSRHLSGPRVLRVVTPQGKQHNGHWRSGKEENQLSTLTCHAQFPKRSSGNDEVVLLNQK